MCILILKCFSLVFLVGLLLQVFLLYSVSIFKEEKQSLIKLLKMKLLLMILSYIGLGLTLIPSILVFHGDISGDQNKYLMMVGTILWFVTAPFWMNKKKEVKQIK